MNSNELALILEEGEGYKIEFKENINNDFSRELVAMANSSGGRIFLGINDSNEITGLDINNNFLSKVQGFADQCDPSVDIEIERFENILIIHVKEGLNKPYRCTKGFYIRSGANSQKLSTREITEFIQAEGKVRFDEIVRPDCPFGNSFAAEKLESFLNIARISRTIDDISILLNLGVVEIKDSQPFFNNAGLLFFSKKPVNHLLHSSITCALYKGKEKLTILDRKDLSGDLIINIEEAILFLKKHLNLSYEITSLRRKEVPEIPEVALRETVVNALCHRDYFEKGANVMIEIFDDRVVISNPGGLPKSLNPKYLGTRSICRNPIVASLLHRAGYIEKMGTGINRIKSAIKESGGKEPLFQFDSFFTVTFSRETTLETQETTLETQETTLETQETTLETQETTLETQETTLEKIISIIKSNPQIKRNDLAKELGLTLDGIEYHLKKMRMDGKIRHVGPTKKGYWEIIEKEED